MDKINAKPLLFCKEQILALPQEHRARIYSLIESTITKLHSLSVSHQDLSLQNILISSDLEYIFLIDLGNSDWISRTPSGQKKDTDSLNFIYKFLRLPNSI